MADAASLTHRTLGDFTVGDKLGEGGYGVVYRAEQRTLGREAVIKVLHARHGTDEALVARFLREAQLASRLDHPFAAHVYAFGAEPDGLLWIAMELVRGTTLRKVLDAQPGGRLPLARLVPLLDGLCEVVHTAHEQGIVHRDLKPDNVMVLSRAGRLLPKLLDLGVAKLVTGAPATEKPGPGPRRGNDLTAAATAWEVYGAASRTDPDPALSATLDGGSGAVPKAGAFTSSPQHVAPEPRIGPNDERTAAQVAPAGASTGSLLHGAPEPQIGPVDERAAAQVTRAGAFIGSPYYMAPEQWIEGEVVDARADQYALGVVAFEMIAGKLPFTGESIHAIARAHLNGAVPELPDGAPRALGEALARALARHPGDRFPSVLAFAEAVRAGAGFRISPEALPRLDDDLRAEIAWLPQPIADAVRQGNLVASAVLSGNRNFEGRVNPHVKANYLASPMLVVVYALAGSMKIDITKDPIGYGKNDKPVYLKDLWPTNQEIADAVRKSVTAAAFKKRYKDVFTGD
ncbi:MAG TPA: protein kinase, partial [Kofleriaceae bacterium]